MPQNIGEGTLDIPPTWFNSSVNIFTAAAPGTAGPSITVNRDRLRPGDTLDSYGSEQIEKLRAKLRAFKLGEHGRATIDGHPAQVHEFTWESPKGQLMHQILVIVQDDERLINIVASHGAVMDRLLRQHMMDILRSFRFVRNRDSGYSR